MGGKKTDIKEILIKRHEDTTWKRSEENICIKDENPFKKKPEKRGNKISLKWTIKKRKNGEYQNCNSWRKALEKKNVQLFFFVPLENRNNVW